MMPTRRTADASFLKKLGHILLDADITLVCVLHGMTLAAWGIMGFMHPMDLSKFAEDFVWYMPMFWGFNSIAVGLAYIWLAVRGIPTGPALALGSYAVICWSWIAASRPTASVTSGATLNFAVIIIGALLLHRSGRGK